MRILLRKYEEALGDHFAPMAKSGLAVIDVKNPKRPHKLVTILPMSISRCAIPVT